MSAFYFPICPQKNCIYISSENIAKLLMLIIYNTGEHDFIKKFNQDQS